MISRGAGLGWLAVVMLAAACSQSTGLSGEVFVAKSGEVKRGAQVDVILVPATEAFEAEWTHALERFQAQRTRMLAAAQESERLQAQAGADRLAATQATRSLVRSEGGVDWRVYDQAKERHTDAVQQWIKAGQRSREARAQLEALEPRHRREAWDLIRKHQARRVKTDERGHFAFAGIPPGRYILASHWTVSGETVQWFVPAELGPGAQDTIDLTDRNGGWPQS